MKKQLMTVDVLNCIELFLYEIHLVIVAITKKRPTSLKIVIDKILLFIIGKWNAYDADTLSVRIIHTPREDTESLYCPVRVFILVS